MPDLSRLLDIIERQTAYHRLLDEIRERTENTVVVLDAAKPYLLAALHHSLRLPILVVTAQPENGKKLC